MPDIMIQAITRFTLVSGGLLGGFAITRLVNWQTQLGLPEYYVIFLFIILGGSIGYVFGGIIGRELTAQWQRTEQVVHETAPADLILGAVGLVMGLLIALLASQPLRLVNPAWLSISATALLMFACGYLGARVTLLKRHDFARAFPALAASELVVTEKRPLVLDTSTIIDGRFVELHRLGFLAGELRVPRFVVGELQTLADSADDTRRAKGRRGLDLLAALPESVNVTVFEADYSDTAQVDEKLLRLSADSRSALVTVDYNLAKVAHVRGVEVLNINDAAGALRPTFLPGETFRLRIVKPGKEAEQGVGYLEDGTMVVVQSARDRVGQDVDVEVSSVLQTSAGRMVFARVGGAEESEVESA
jgi:uncharacterized protein YacL